MYKKNAKSPSDLKLADVTCWFMKKSNTSKDNYKPLSILPNISEIYEKCLHNQMQQYL